MSRFFPEVGIVHHWSDHFIIPTLSILTPQEILQAIDDPRPMRQEENTSYHRVT